MAADPMTSPGDPRQATLVADGFIMLCHADLANTLELAGLAARADRVGCDVRLSAADAA